MKRIGFLLVLTLALLVIGSGDACGIRLGRSVRPYKRPMPRLSMRVNRRVLGAARPVKRPAAQEVSRLRQRYFIRQNRWQREYTQLAQQQARQRAADLRIQKLLQTVSPHPRIELLRRRAFPSRQEVDAVIFDLDGTLVDSLWAWEDSGSNYVRSLGLKPPADLDAKLETLSLMDGAKYVKEMYHLPDPPEVILEKTLEPIKNRYFYEIEPMPGVREQLAQLKAQGVKMAVATASHKEFAQAALKRLGMLDYFEFIITCDEVGIGKTSPKVYEEALARLGTLKERTLVAEDALHALQTAHRAGFPTAAIEEAHSLEQAAQKLRVADYYIIQYSGQNTLGK